MTSFAARQGMVDKMETPLIVIVKEDEIPVIVIVHAIVEIEIQADVMIVIGTDGTIVTDVMIVIETDGTIVTNVATVIAKSTEAVNEKEVTAVNEGETDTATIMIPKADNETDQEVDSFCP
jgi:hypothetical protein